MAEQLAVTQDFCVIIILMTKKRTYADRREYMIATVAKRRRKVKEMARAYLGNKCLICGYDRCPEALDFHHLDESSKEFWHRCQRIYICMEKSSKRTW